MKKLYKIGGFAVALLMATTILVPANASAQTTTNMCSGLVRDLTLGSTGSDVVVLQTFLEQKAYLTIPAGVSKGYFGALTQSAVAKYQMANGISPIAGYFGPLTRGKLVAACATTSNPGNGNNNGNNGGLNGGEASLESFNLSSGDDSEVKEGNSAEVAEIEFDVEDGDIMIDRIDLRLVADSANEEEDPWDTFESLRLIIDGKEVAEVDLSDEDEYLDEDEGTIRLSNINAKIEEGETANIVVEVTAQNSVDGADNNTSSWTINVEDDGIRATDAEGIQQYVGSDSQTVEFEVVEQGEGEELNISSSTEDPDATTFNVEDDSKSDEHDIFAFDLQGEESDIEIDTVQVVLESDVSVSSVLSDLVLEIDGEEFDDWSYIGGGTLSRTVEFDIDGDYTLDADSEVTIVLKAQFKAANGSNYSSGTTIRASVVNGALEGEGSDDVVSEGSVTGDTHTLAISGVVTSDSSKSYESVENTDTTNADNEGVYEFRVSLTAFEGDFYIPDSVAIGSSTAGFSVNVTGDTYTGTTTAYISEVNLDDDTKQSGRYKVSEDETAVFTVVVRLDPNAQGAYGLELDAVNYGATPGSSLTTYLFPDTSKYEIAKSTIKN